MNCQNTTHTNHQGLRCRYSSICPYLYPLSCPCCIWCHSAMLIIGLFLFSVFRDNLPTRLTNCPSKICLRWQLGRRPWTQPAWRRGCLPPPNQTSLLKTGSTSSRSMGCPDFPNPGQGKIDHHHLLFRWAIPQFVWFEGKFQVCGDWRWKNWDGCSASAAWHWCQPGINPLGHFPGLLVFQQVIPTHTPLRKFI